MHHLITRTVKRTFARAGLQLSSTANTIVIPKPRPGPPTFRCTGIEWGAPGIDRFMRGPLTQYAPEYQAFPQAPDGDPRHYFWDNSFFGLTDAAVCYALIRSRQPALVVEVGSGYSSRLIRSALDQNGRGRLLCIDPSPRAPVDQVAHEYQQREVQTLPVRWFRDLPTGSVVFIDSSHLAGTGSDVNFLFLEVLPELQPGVLIHIHDIYLPDDYPTSWNIDRKFNYSEQYLLHSLLCYSYGFRVVWPGRWVLQQRAADLRQILGPGADLGRHCSFWMERTVTDRGTDPRGVE
ncbi:MAG TPA: class I SAM-dependent methyltransferase [Chloroflexia bacterium]|nr:class I SAM-dependent methyltransferase [Chloroflexia bacterium]